MSGDSTEGLHFTPEQAIEWLSDPELRGCGGDKACIALIRQLAQQRQEIERRERQITKVQTALEIVGRERDALREQVEKLTAELGDDAWDGRCACRIDPDENEHLCSRHSEMEADNAALREKLRSIELAAEDATEYVLATLLREQKEENATLRTRVEALEAEVESGWTHAKHVAERDALRARCEEQALIISELTERNRAQAQALQGMQAGSAEAG